MVIGASAGGIPALEAICADLPENFAAPVLIVMHVGPQGNELLNVLRKCCRLPVSYAVSGQNVEVGKILIAAPGKNLTVVSDGGQIRIILTDSGNPILLRPTIDPLFLSAAEAFKKKVIGIVLSGFLDDGTNGLRAIKDAGGTAIVQEPLDALCQDMPKNAIRNVVVDSILCTDAIGPAVTALVNAARVHNSALRVASLLEN